MVGTTVKELKPNDLSALDLSGRVRIGAPVQQLSFAATKGFCSSNLRSHITGKHAITTAFKPTTTADLNRPRPSAIGLLGVYTTHSNAVVVHATVNNLQAGLVEPFLDFLKRMARAQLRMIPVVIDGGVFLK